MMSRLLIPLLALALSGCINSTVRLGTGNALSIGTGGANVPAEEKASEER